MNLWQDDEVTTSTQGMMRRVFDFFSENVDVPEALIAASDGDVCRAIWGDVNRAQGIPDVLNSHAALLLTRSDRVDAFVRPHVLPELKDVNPRDMKSDPTRFWHYFWERTSSEKGDDFDDYFIAQEARQGRKVIDSPGTMSTEWWMTQLPYFWNDVRLDKSYEPSSFLPVRWTGGQLKRFDESALFGYLTRPVTVHLRSQHGEPLDVAETIEALRSGWEQALALLPPDGKPQRVFYDTSRHPEWEGHLSAALKGSSHPLDIMQEPVGYDMYKRLGDTGAVSAVGQIALATIASHGDGKVTATISLGLNGEADILVVTPADEVQREKNRHGPGSYDLFGREE